MRRWWFGVVGRGDRVLRQFGDRRGECTSEERGVLRVVGMVEGGVRRDDAGEVIEFGVVSFEAGDLR